MMLRSFSRAIVHGHRDFLPPGATRENEMEAADPLV
jgi:hypothetical protein